MQLDYKDIIIKHYALSMSGSEIARQTGFSKSGVNDFLRAFKKCEDLSYPLPVGITNYGIALKVYGSVPGSLAKALKMHPEVKTIVFHLDNDRIGRLATKAISTVLPKQYQVKDVPPKQGKDYNDQLCIKLNLAITKREKNTKKNMSGHEK